MLVGRNEAVVPGRERRLDLVVDAVRAITEEGGREAIHEMLAAGARLVTTDEVCSGSLQPQAIVSAGNP